MKRTLLALLTVALVVPAVASEPGQPLDCSDWVFLQSGYSCSVFSPMYAAMTPPMRERGANRVVDNTGALITAVGGDPNAPNWLDNYIEIRRHDGIMETVIGRIQGRDFPDGRDSVLGVNPAGGPEESNDYPHLAAAIQFDAVNGRLLVPLCSAGNGYYGYWIAAIDGFAKLFDILQTYTPSSTAFSFRVPSFPEGLRGADYFDTYWGDLATVGNWPAAHALQCHYPTAAPDVGDYLTVADTLPLPQPGHGYYYVTAAAYQGQTRYGRKTSGGTLSGRDPALLPRCGSEHGDGGR